MNFKNYGETDVKQWQTQTHFSSSTLVYKVANIQRKNCVCTSTVQSILWSIWCLLSTYMRNKMSGADYRIWSNPMTICWHITPRSLTKYHIRLRWCLHLESRILLDFLPWRQQQQVPPKHQYLSIKIHGIICQILIQL
jgi:hypothetical protein